MFDLMGMVTCMKATTAEIGQEIAKMHSPPPTSPSGEAVFYKPPLKPRNGSVKPNQRAPSAKEGQFKKEVN